MALPRCSLMKGALDLGALTLQHPQGCRARHGSTKKDEAWAAKSLLIYLLMTQWACFNPLLRLKRQHTSCCLVGRAVQGPLAQLNKEP